LHQHTVHCSVTLWKVVSHPVLRTLNFGYGKDK
jgi:hypothetical protein